MAPFIHRLRVRYNECDPQGIVFNGNWLMYFDVTLTEWWRAAFGSYQSMVDAGTDLVVAEANVRFRAPARFDDELDVAVTVAELGTTSMTTRFDITRASEHLVEGRMRHVFIDPATLAKQPIPDVIRGRLAAYAE
jgi:acyl-CoA thioester hydrolase